MGNKQDYTLSEVTAVTKISHLMPEPGESTASLVVIYGEDLGQKFELLSGSMTIGRSSKNQIAIHEESASREHASIEQISGQFLLTDLRSTNGTYVNDAAVQKQILQDGDCIKIGRTILKFMTSNNVEQQYHDEIYHLMTKDGLTQLHNKRHFEEVLDKEIVRARRYSKTFAIVIFDIDHFKQVNDTYGHLAGDAVLRQIGLLINKNIRQNDVAARVGGEEFAVFLPEITREQAARVAEKLRVLIEELVVEFEEEKINPTVSLGVGSWRNELENKEGIIKEADENLYKAKHAGRNQVCS